MLEELGYKRLINGLWGKSVGNCMFVFSPETNEWLNCFNSYARKLTVYERKQFEGYEGELGDFIRLCEAGTRINFYYDPVTLEDWQWL